MQRVMSSSVESGDRNALRGETLEPMLDTLYSSFEKFGEAEEAFLNKVLGVEKGEGGE